MISTIARILAHWDALAYNVLNVLHQEFWEGLVSGRDLTEPHRWPQGLYGIPPTIGALRDVNRFDNFYFDIPDEQVECFSIFYIFKH